MILKLLMNWCLTESTSAGGLPLVAWTGKDSKEKVEAYTAELEVDLRLIASAPMVNDTPLLPRTERGPEVWVLSSPDGPVRLNTADGAAGRAVSGNINAAGHWPNWLCTVCKPGNNGHFRRCCQPRHVDDRITKQCAGVTEVCELGQCTMGALVEYYSLIADAGTCLNKEVALRGVMHIFNTTTAGAPLTTQVHEGRQWAAPVVPMRDPRPSLDCDQQFVALDDWLEPWNTAGWDGVGGFVGGGATGYVREVGEAKKRLYTTLAAELHAAEKLGTTMDYGAFVKEAKLALCAVDQGCRVATEANKRPLKGLCEELHVRLLSTGLRRCVTKLKRQKDTVGDRQLFDAAIAKLLDIRHVPDRSKEVAPNPMCEDCKIGRAYFGNANRTKSRNANEKAEAKIRWCRGCAMLRCQVEVSAGRGPLLQCQEEAGGCKQEARGPPWHGLVTAHGCGDRLHGFKRLKESPLASLQAAEELINTADVLTAEVDALETGRQRGEQNPKLGRSILNKLHTFVLGLYTAAGGTPWQSFLKKKSLGLMTDTLYDEAMMLGILHAFLIRGWFTFMDCIGMRAVVDGCGRVIVRDFNLFGIPVH